jgi:ATP-dependent Lhr-like helicase
VSLLRKLRREPAPGELITICASDPLNLVGIVTPGARIPQLPSTRILLRDGVPVAALDGSGVRWLLAELLDTPPAERERLEQALLGERRGAAPRSASALSATG